MLNNNSKHPRVLLLAQQTNTPLQANPQNVPQMPAPAPVPTTPQVPVPAHANPPPLLAVNTLAIRPRMAFINLLARHEHAVPSFDKDWPEEIKRYFSDLADILHTHTVIADNECNVAALKYVKHHQTDKLWQSLPTFANGASTFEAFKADILWLYPNSSTDWTYTTHDLDLLIGEQAR